MMSFDTEPDHDEHSECRREIQELSDRVFQATADNGDLRRKLRETEAELARLREQSAREHAAWAGVPEDCLGKGIAGKALVTIRYLGVDFYCAEFAGRRRYGPSPVDAVLAVVEAAKRGGE